MPPGMILPRLDGYRLPAKGLSEGIDYGPFAMRNPPGQQQYSVPGKLPYTQH
jgi:hypothetical protein